MTVVEGFLSTPEALEAFGERSFVDAMLRFEAALARAQAPGRRLMEPSSRKATPRWRSTPRKAFMPVSELAKRSPI